MSSSYFDEYRWSWTIHQLLPYVDKVFGISGAMDFRPINVENDLTLRLPLVILCLFVSNKTLLTFAHVVNVVSWFYWMPAVWDHMCWVALLEVVFVVASLFSLSKKQCMANFLPSARGALIVLYFSAAFWKLTKSFLDPVSSCANTLVAELAAALLTPEQIPADSSFAKYLMLSAPAQIIGIEFLVPVVLWLCPRPGIPIALLFHYAINCMPVTYAGGFSIAMCCRLLIFMPGTLTNTKGGLALPVLVTGILTGIFLHCHRGKIDASGAAFLLYSLQYFRSSFAGYVPAPTDKPFPFLKSFALFLAFFYGFAAPILGLMAMASSTMYGNVVEFGGKTNHLVVPTGLLQEWYREQGPDWLVDAFGGGQLRLEYSDSQAFRAQVFGVDISDDQPDHARAILSATNSSGKYYELYASRNYYNREDDHQATALTTHEKSEKAVGGKFAVPAYELRRLLDVAHEKETDYVVEYVKLPNYMTTASEWRDYVPSDMVRYEVKDGLAVCNVVPYDKSEEKGVPCDIDEIAMLPPPPTWLRSFLHPYPLPLLPDVGDNFVCTT